MGLFEHILYPVDLSKPCREIWPHVRGMVEQFHSKLTILHAIQIPPPWYGEVDASRFAAYVDVAGLKQQRQSDLDAFLREELQGQKPERVLIESEPAEAITEFADMEKVGLIMMPTRGGGRFRRFLLGSVTAKVLHDAHCAVWTSVHAADTAKIADTTYRVVLCAVDLEPGSAGLVTWASQFASAYGAALRAIHVIPGVDEDSRNATSIQVRQVLYERARERWAAVREEAGVEIELCLAGGPIAAGVRSTALAHEANLVVIGRGRLQRTLGGLRSGGYQIIREAPCPVLSV
jgi:nucleotide-binding universal stress UspA family protein